MEQANRLIDEDYSLAMAKYEQANKIFAEAEIPVYQLLQKSIQLSTSG